MSETSVDLPRMVARDSVGGSIGVSLGSFLMALVSLHVVFVGWTAGQPPGWLFEILPRQLLGMVGVIGFTATGLRGLRGIRGRPRLVLDAEGIHDLSGRRPLLIPWSEVTAVTPHGRSHVDVAVADPQRILGRLPWFRRQLQRATMALGRRTFRYAVGGKAFRQADVLERMEAGADAAELDGLLP